MTTENWFFGSNCPTPPTSTSPLIPSTTQHATSTPPQSSSQASAHSSPTIPSSSSQNSEQENNEDPFAASFRLESTPWNDDDPPTTTGSVTRDSPVPWDTRVSSFWDTPDTTSDDAATSPETDTTCHTSPQKNHHHTIFHRKNDHSGSVRYYLILFLCGMLCGGILLWLCTLHDDHHTTIMPVKILSTVTSSPVASLPPVEQAVATSEHDAITSTPQSLLMSEVHLETVWTLAMEQDALTMNSTLHTLLTTLMRAKLSGAERHTVQEWNKKWGTVSVLPTTSSLTAAQHVIAHAQLLLTTLQKNKQ